MAVKVKPTPKVKANRTRTEIKPGDIVSHEDISEVYPGKFIVYRMIDRDVYARMEFLAVFESRDDVSVLIRQLRADNPGELYGVTSTFGTSTFYDR